MSQTTWAPLPAKPQLICANCQKPWGDHAARGEWCQTYENHGPIFSKTHKFTTIPEVSK